MESILGNRRSGGLKMWGFHLNLKMFGFDLEILKLGFLVMGMRNGDSFLPGNEVFGEDQLDNNSAFLHKGNEVFGRDQLDNNSAFLHKGVRRYLCLCLTGCRLACLQFVSSFCHWFISWSKGGIFSYIIAIVMDNGRGRLTFYISRRVASDGSNPSNSYCSRRVLRDRNFYVGETSTSSCPDHGEGLSASYAPVGQGSISHSYTLRDVSTVLSHDVNSGIQTASRGSGVDDVPVALQESHQLCNARSSERHAVDASNSTHGRRCARTSANTTRRIRRRPTRRRYYY